MIGSARSFGFGSNPAMISFGTWRRISFSMSVSSGLSSAQTSDIASPVAPARPVRPMRCT
jgi:hypothetical protein